MDPAALVENRELVRIVVGARLNEGANECRLARATPARQDNRPALPRHHPRVNEQAVLRVPSRLEFGVILEGFEELLQTGPAVNQLAVAREVEGIFLCSVRTLAA